MKEIWKDIKDYEGLYQISNLGRIRKTKNKNILKPFLNTNKYYQIVLYKNGKSKHTLIHKLVANAFIINDNNLPFINHKDENKQNNYANNLEWCTSKYNCNYGSRNLRLSTPVICIELNRKFDSIKQASSELNVRQSDISNCCAKRKSYKTAGGYHWQYVKG